MKSNLPEKPTFGFSDPELQKRFEEAIDSKTEKTAEAVAQYNSLNEVSQLRVILALTNDAVRVIAKMRALGLPISSLLESWLEGIERKEKEENHGC